MSAKHRGQPEEQPQSTGADAFWATSTAEAEAYKKRFTDQISRLQERQKELVQQTADELEILKQELSDSKDLEQKITSARQPLLDEINALRASMAAADEHNASLQEQLRHVQRNYQSQYLQLQGLVSSLKNTLRGQARTLDQQIRVYSLDATQSLESMLSSLDAAQLPPFEAPEITVGAAPVHHPAPRPAPAPALAQTIALPVSPLVSNPKQDERFAKHEAKLRAEAVRKADVHPASRKRSPIRRFAIRSIIAALFAAAGVTGVHNFLQHNTSHATTDTGTVAGVSTEAAVDVKPATEQYPESFATVSYADTVWEQTSDGEMGVAFKYPKNASNRVRELSGNNLWILRFWDYLFKINRDDSTSSIDTWMTNNQATYVDDYISARGTFKNQSAWILTPKVKSATSGTMYVISHGKTVLNFWIKDEDPNSDDGKRLADMVTSIQLLPPQ